MVTANTVQKDSTYQQIWRFVVVGVINTAIDLIVLNLLIHFTGRGHSGAFYVLFKAILFTCATVNSYLMNRRWTFVSTGQSKAVASQFSQFLGVSIIGLVVNVAAASLWVTFVPVLVVSAALWPSVGALFGTACGLLVNFFGYKFLGFTKKTA